MSNQASCPHLPVAYFPEPESEELLAATSSMATPAPTKKARTTRNARSETSARRTRTKLRGFGPRMADFPIDVLYEILLYVEPLDILNMSRVNKGVHDALTSNSSRFVWKKAIENANLPQCPEDLNEMQYTNFILDPYCNFCGQVGRQRDQYQHLFHSREKVCAKFRVPTFTLWKGTKYGEPGDIFAHGKAIKEWDDQFAAFEDSQLSARNEWEENLKNETRKFLQLEDAMTSWFEDADAAEASKRDSARQARLEAILAKLREEGWANEVATLEEGEVMPMSKLRKMKGVTSITTLTQKAWEKMKPDLTAFMSEVNAAQEIHDREMEEERLAQEKAEEERRLAEIRTEQVQTRVPLFIKAFSDYQLARPYDPYGPRAADLAELPEVQVLIFKPLDEDVDQQAFDTLLNKSFDELSSRWRISVENTLLEIMKRKLPEATKEDMWNPAVMFACQYPCFQVLSTSNALAHSACEQRKISSLGFEFPDAPWRGSNLIFQHEIYNKARPALGRIQPRKTVESLHVDLYECVECSQDRGRRVLTSWFEALSNLESCLLAKGHSLQLISLTEEEKKQRDTYLAVKYSTSKVEIVCSTCRTVCSINGWQVGFSKHQAECHGNTATTWREGLDFYRTADAVKVLTFGKDYVLDTNMDAHAVVFKLMSRYYQRGYGRQFLDLRTDEDYARKNYMYLHPTIHVE